MFIINPENVLDLKAYKCDIETSEYLIYKKGMPLLAFNWEEDGKPYLFAITEQLTDALKEYSEQKANKAKKSRKENIV